MPSTTGYVGTIEVETRGTSRIWFSLTERPNSDDWVNIGRHRAWFTMNLETADRPIHMAQLPLLLESLREGVSVKVYHGGAGTDFYYDHRGDSFPVERIRILRKPMNF